MATPVTSPEPAAPAPAPPPKAHQRRFLAFYAVLAALLAAGAAVGVHMTTREIVKPPPWSAWVPINTTPEAAVREIAVHVQGSYLGPNGKEISTIRGGPLSVGSDPAVLVKPDSAATGGYKFFEGSSVEYQICGTTTKGNCTIDQKKIAPNTSGALTRRMAYELALTTFHYVPEVQNVAVLLPAVIKGQKARMLVLSRSENKDPKSLDSAIVPIRKVGKPTPEEALKIAAATDPLIFHYEVTATSDNQPVYLITPLLIKDTAAAAGSAMTPP
jgi:hypothetical protein